MITYVDLDREKILFYTSAKAFIACVGDLTDYKGGYS
jgi:hypothetical protein